MSFGLRNLSLETDEVQRWAGWPSLHTNTTEVAPPFAVFEGWVARTRPGVFELTKAALLIFCSFPRVITDSLRVRRARRAATCVTSAIALAEDMLPS
jgi:hypothetical protein